ncbi:hypothetical protein F5I97DRAFT_1635326 [Phlebopus sp. FC_14]|nr:hypothetical protein F5I97DRAFT_1635326 [Phlebopus sp. FC_14]
MRQLVRYDPDDLPGPSKMSGNRSPAHSPPSKKRKQSHPRTQHIQHWDDPGSSREEVVYDEQEEDVREDSYRYEEAGAGLPGEVGEEEESRELTYEEIWDDSALIDAWNSATAEYEAYHGKSKDWKADSVKKSLLWYNKPYTGPKSQGNTSKANHYRITAQSPDNEEDDTTPLDFGTFVPTHDPSLSGPSKPPPATQSSPAIFIPSPSTTMVSRDEAFNNALSAMYWSGYWTAIYHAQSQSNGQEVVSEGDHDGEGEEEEEYGEEVDGNEDDLVPAQR